MTSKLQRLIDGCKASVHININDHRSVYQTAEARLDEDASEYHPDNPEPVAGLDVVAGMIARDSIVKIQFYPNTPIGSYTVYHWDLDQALDECLALMEKKP